MRRISVPDRLVLLELWKETSTESPAEPTAIGGRLCCPGIVPISCCHPVLAQQLGDAGKTTVAGYQRQLGRQRVRGDQPIVAAHRLIVARLPIRSHSPGKDTPGASLGTREIERALDPGLVAEPDGRVA